MVDKIDKKGDKKAEGEIVAERIGNFSLVEIEKEIFDFWNKNKIYEAAVEKNKNNKRFHYLDGPPYTSGKIHIGHAWGKALRDSIMRFKRMDGFCVSDQPGFDMHGLPIENQVEKNLGINKQDILASFGVEKFNKECEKYALEMMKPMINDFSRVGVWMDWSNPYMTLKTEYVEGAWYALAIAEKKGYLYEGKKAMTWCPDCATALAKHELEYDERTDDSIFVKFKLVDKENEFLVIWTTTPWTLPFNMGVMVHPDFDYVRAKIKSTDGKSDEIWVVAKAAATGFITGVAEKSFEVLEEFRGEKLEGVRYHHPFFEESIEQQTFFKTNKKAHSVLLSAEHVALDSGSGLVHCAPGCGPEDFEVGKKYGLPAFNTVDEFGKFSNNFGPLSGLTAKKDDSKFISHLESKGTIVAKTKINHEYAHCWRSKTPVIFRATDQWFLAVEKVKDKMIEENKNILWVPEWAGSRWFNSWLNNLQDWCISRQRFWGIPLPIWKCDDSNCNKIKVIGSRAELEKLSGEKVVNIHRPFVDKIKIKCDCGKSMQRIPDILDVWFDSGCVPWSSLDYPSNKRYESMQTPDLILEGKDQIRGWFNSLACMSMTSFGKIPFKAVYMHGFVNDSQGRKFSKSLKNGVSPYEVVDKYGADVLRYYMIGGATPGLDINYNYDDMIQKSKNLAILWNLHNFLIDYAKTLNKNPHTLLSKNKLSSANLDVAEKYIISKANSTLKTVTEKFNKYELNEIPWIIEDLYLALSRTYIQEVRDKSSIGTEAEKETVLLTIYYVLLDTIKMFAPVAPFICEKIYQDLKKEFGLNDQSIHLCSWPKYEDQLINLDLEKSVELSDKIITSILFAREKAQVGVRWPLSKVHVVVKEKSIKQSIENMSKRIKSQANLREVIVSDEYKDASLSVKPNSAKINPAFKSDAPKIIAKLVLDLPKSILKNIDEKGKHEVKIEDGESKKIFAILKEHLLIERSMPQGILYAEFSGGEIYLDSVLTKELEAEGFSREIMRRVQSLRKDAGLKKADSINLFVYAQKSAFELIKEHHDSIAQKCGAKSLTIESEKPTKAYSNSKEEKIKGKDFGIYFDVA